MGNNTGIDNNTNLEIMMSRFEITGEELHDNTKYLLDKATKKEYLLKEFIFSNKKDFDVTLQTILLRRSILQHEHLLSLVEISTKSNIQFCSTISKIQVLFEYPQRTLDDETNQRTLQYRHYNPKELWTILASCVLGLSHLQKFSIKHECLRSSQIFIDSSGIIKLKDPFITSSLNNFNIVSNRRSTPHIYLSPEQCVMLRNQLRDTGYQSHSSDVFTLGMIILETALLQYMDYCYREEYSRIDWEVLNNCVNKFAKLYPQDLTNTVSMMLQSNPKLRWGWLELEQNILKIDDHSEDPPVDSRIISRKSHSQLVLSDYGKSEQMVSSSRNESSNQLTHVVEKFIQGSKYEGQKLRGMRHGKGRFYYQDGGLYDGDWFNNKIHGYGKLYYQSGMLAYEGSWKQDKFHGFGKLYNESVVVVNGMFDFHDLNPAVDYWVLYEGQFKEDQREGQGRLVLSNGEMYEGQFKNDMIQGEGVFVRSNNDKIRGRWEANKLLDFINI